MSSMTPPDEPLAPASEPPAGDEPRRDDDIWSEAQIEQLRSMIGGKSGIADGAIPAVLFVASNAIWSLRVAAVAAAGYGLAATLYRVARRQPVKHALIGLAGLVLSVGITLWTSNPNTYFLPGTAYGALIGALFLLTVAFRMPTSAMFAMALERREREYYERPAIKRLHMGITAMWGVVFLARAAFRAVLIANDQTELLGASAVILGYPVTLGLAGVSVLLLRRAAQRQDAAPATES